MKKLDLLFFISIAVFICPCIGRLLVIALVMMKLFINVSLFL